MKRNEKLSPKSIDIEVLPEIKKICKYNFIYILYSKI